MGKKKTKNKRETLKAGELSMWHHHISSFSAQASSNIAFFFNICMVSFENKSCHCDMSMNYMPKNLHRPTGKKLFSCEASIMDIDTILNRMHPIFFPNSPNQPHNRNNNKKIIFLKKKVCPWKIVVGPFYWSAKIVLDILRDLWFKSTLL